MKIDWATPIGLTIALGGIAWGLLLEGGSLYEILQPTAALIVFGGTLGATLVSQPFPVFQQAVRQVPQLFAQPSYRFQAVIDQIVQLANQARRSGIVSLDKRLHEVSDPFLRKAITLAVDGIDPKDLREILENEIEQDAVRRETEARVFETAGGFAPTIGIIGAVLGLIQVMKHLEDINEVGRGIAVAFVATIYGVGIANLVLLPAAKKIMSRARHVEVLRHLMLEGAVALAEGLNPRIVRSRLEGYLQLDYNSETEASEPLKV